jgi:plastocyanin
MRAKTRASLTSALVVSGLLLAGCGGGNDSGGGGGGSQPADVVVHGSDDLKFDMKSYSARSGSITIELIDDGSQPHTLLFDGQSFKKLAVDRKGDTDKRAITLQPGTYTIYCDIAGHRAAGMEAKLVVN